MSYTMTSVLPSGNKVKRTILEVGDSLKTFNFNMFGMREVSGTKLISNFSPRSKYKRHQGVQECERRKMQ